jgi:geranylgeranyl reductase family protein
MSHLHDVVIVGAGPGGSTTAAFLARAGLDVMLLDKADFPRDKSCGDLISPIAVQILSKLGLEPSFQKFGFRVEGATLTSPKGELLRGPLPSHPSFHPYAYVIKRVILDDLIRQAALRFGAHFEGRVRIRTVQPQHEQELRVIGERGSERIEYRGRLVILAVGANLPLLQSLGLTSGPVDFAYAARAYFEGVQEIDHHIHLHFNGVPLPGGGWIFPLPNGMANVGAGFYQRSERKPSTAANTLTRFLANPSIQAKLNGARQVGPINSYILRTNFHRSSTLGPRMLVVGEAAGLVNPLTGEGIHYAVESGELASDCVRACFEEGDFSSTALMRYDKILRSRFQRMFTLSTLMRRFYMNSFLLDPMVRACNRWPEISERVVNILMAYQDPADALRPDVILKTLRCLRPSRSNLLRFQ